MEPKDSDLKEFLIEKFAGFLSGKRRRFIEQVLANRTAHIRVVLEDFVDSHNVNAVLRTGECLGIQHYDIIEDQGVFKVGRGVSKGATKWIDIHRYESASGEATKSALNQLREEGFKILVTSPNAEAISMEAIDLAKPVALLFGNEKVGASAIAKEMADEVVKIPSFGFTESYNVSVSAGILLYQLVNRMRTEVSNWQLPADELNDYRLEWYKKCMARPHYYQNYFVKAFEAKKKHA